MFTLWNDFRDAGFGDLARTFASMEKLHQDLDRRARSHAPRSLHTPRIHVHEGEQAVAVRLEVPGFAKDDLEITLTGDVLTVRGERGAKLPEGYAVHRRERGALGFNRSFRLPRDVDGSKVEANIKDGVLTLTIPKVPEAQPRRIEVKVHS